MDQPCVSFNLIQAAGGAAARRTWHYPGQRVKIRAISLDPNATSAANASDHVTLAFYVGSTQIGSSRTTDSDSGTALTQGTSEAISLSSVAPSNLEVTSTSQFSVRATQGGSGVALDVQVHVVYEAM